MTIDELKNDHTSGAKELLHKAGLWLQQEARSVSGGNSTEILEHMRQWGLALVHAQPRMAPMFNLVNQILNHCEIPNVSVKSIEEQLEMILSRSQQDFLAMNRYIVNVLKSGCTILTISRSSSVMQLLRQLSYQITINVIVLESRPGYEGRTAAKELADAGIPVTLLTDAAMGRAVAMADVIFTGTDAFDNKQFINKTGTLPLALLARENKAPFFVLASTMKYLPDIHLLPPEDNKPGNEVWPELPYGSEISILNQYFENVPLHLVAGVITEKGIRVHGSKALMGFKKNHWLWDNIRKLRDNELPRKKS